MSMSFMEIHFENLEIATVNGVFVKEFEYTINNDGYGEAELLKLKLSKDADTTYPDMYSDTQTLFQRLEYRSDIVSISAYFSDKKSEGFNVKWEDSPFKSDTNVLQQSYRNEEDGSMLILINEPAQNLRTYSHQFVEALSDALNLPVVLRKIADKLDNIGK